MPASKTKGKCAGNTPSTLIFAPVLRYNINRGLCSEFSAVQKTRPAEIYNPDQEVQRAMLTSIIVNGRYKYLDNRHTFELCAPTYIEDNSLLKMLEHCGNASV